ncbi:hypothetical protein ACEPAI_8302 [Sanghuangporus weigelae]
MVNGEQFIAIVCSQGRIPQTFNFDPFAEETVVNSHGFTSVHELDNFAAIPRPAPRPAPVVCYQPQPVRVPAIQDAIRRFEEMARAEECRASRSESMTSIHPPILRAASKRRPNPLALPENEQSTLPMHRRVIERPKARNSPQPAPAPHVQPSSIWTPKTDDRWRPNLQPPRPKPESDSCIPERRFTRIQPEGVRTTGSITFLHQSDSARHSDQQQRGRSPGQWPPKPTFVLPKRRKTPMPSPLPSSPDRDTQDGNNSENDSDNEERDKPSRSTHGEDELLYTSRDEMFEEPPMPQQTAESDSEDWEDYYIASEFSQNFEQEFEDARTNAEQVAHCHTRTSSTKSRSPPLSPFSLAGTNYSEYSAPNASYTNQSTVSVTYYASPAYGCPSIKPALLPDLRWLESMSGAEFAFIMAAEKALPRMRPMSNAHHKVKKREHMISAIEQGVE